MVVPLPIWPKVFPPQQDMSPVVLTAQNETFPFAPSIACTPVSVSMDGGVELWAGSAGLPACPRELSPQQRNRPLGAPLASDKSAQVVLDPAATAATGDSASAFGGVKTRSDPPWAAVGTPSCPLSLVPQQRRPPVEVTAQA